MTTFYSDHYSAKVGETGHFTTLLAPVPLLSPGESAGRMRKRTARILVPSGQDLGSGDIIRVMDFRSSARIFDLRASMDADWGATTTFDIGLYKKGANNDGAVIDADLFASAVDWAAAIARVDYFKEATTLTDMDRGQPLWFLADLGAGTYTEDPFETWTLALTTTQDISATAAAVTIMIEVDYLAGD